MASDNEEDEEEIEPENEEDRAFLDDEMQEQEDVSFYRRLNVEVNRERRQQLRQTREQLEELQDIVGGSGFRGRQWPESPQSTRGETEGLYTRTASVGFQFRKVRPECFQRIPVPVPHQASAHQVYCEKE